MKVGDFMTDVVIVGGGVIGLSIAWELAGHGVSVRVLDQQALGREASWAGAGMLPPGKLSGATTPEARLRAASHQLWPEWHQQLREETGLDNGYCRCGGIMIPFAADPKPFEHWLATTTEEGVVVETLSGSAVRERFPFLAPELTQAALVQEMAQVRNPRHLSALKVGCEHRGVMLLPGHPVIGVRREGDRVLAVQTPLGDFSADEFVFAGGAWSTSLLSRAGIAFPVEPVRGQIVLLNQSPLQFHTIVEQGKRYVVPRPDGNVLIGSTEERVGFQKENTAEAISDLIRFATELIPSLKSARFEQAWSGLRPFRQGELPHLGRIDGLKNVCVAAGHFRAGLQMSPITAVLIRQILLGQNVQLPAECHV